MRELLSPGFWFSWLARHPYQTLVCVVAAVLAVPVARAEGWIASPGGARAARPEPTGTRLTRLGWGALGVAILTIMSAGSTGNNLLYLLFSAVVSSLILSLLAGWWNLRGLECEAMAQPQVFRDADFPLQLTLRRTGSWPSFGVTARLGACRARAAVLRSGSNVRLELRARALNRGWNLLAGLILESRFPWGLVVHRRRMPPAKALAMPRLREIHAPGEVRADARASGRPSLRKGSGDELFGIRSYDPGDDVRKINWKLSARTGRPLVNEFCETHDSKITVRVPASFGADAERRVEEAASACRYYIDSGVEVRLVTPESEVDYGKGLLHLDRLLLALALEGDGRRPRASRPVEAAAVPASEEPRAVLRLTFLGAVLVYAAVFLIDDVDPRVWAGLLPLLALGWYVQEKRWNPIPDAAWSLASIAMLSWATLIDWRSAGFTTANVHLLMYLLANRLLNPLKSDELPQTFLIYFLTFFLVSGLTISPWYFAFFLGYLGFAACWLWLASGASWRERGQWAPALAGWTATCLALAFLCFAAAPRVEGLRRITPMLAELDKFRPKQASVTGFSENVSLGWFGELKRSSARVMKVDFAQPVAARPPALRIRGAAYDAFDGRSWKKELVDFKFSREGREATSTGGRGWASRRGLELRLPAPNEGASSSYRFSLYPLGLSVLFTVGTPWFVGGIDDNAYFDYTDSLYVGKPYLGGLRYVIFSAGEPSAPKVGLANMEPALKRRYLSVPPDPSGKVAGLARRAAGKAATDAARAAAIERYLRAHYDYSTYSDSKGRPLDDFLFDSKKGNCEYFASAGVVLMRSVGIPARLVTGFFVGDWNEYGQFYDVRQRSAHAWVEAYLAGRGWTVFDPTPAQGALSLSADALTRRIERLFDAFQGQWYRSVIGYDQNSQRDAFARIGGALSLNKVLGWLRMSFIALALIWGLWGIGTAALQAKARWGRAGRLGPYGRAEALLSRAGLPRPPEMTPREFASWIARRRPELAGITELAEQHYLERYAGRPAGGEERAKGARLLHELSAKL